MSLKGRPTESAAYTLQPYCSSPEFGSRYTVSPTDASLKSHSHVTASPFDSSVVVGNAETNLRAIGLRPSRSSLRGRPLGGTPRFDLQIARGRAHRRRELRAAAAELPKRIFRPRSMARMTSSPDARPPCTIRFRTSRNSSAALQRCMRKLKSFKQRSERACGGSAPAVWIGEGREEPSRLAFRFRKRVRSRAA